MAELRLTLLGAPQLTLDGAKVNGRLPLKSHALICYLASHNRDFPRIEIAGALWGEMRDDFASRNLRVALAKIRPLFKNHLHISRQTLAFNRAASYWLDVEMFEYTLKRADRAKGAARRAILREAVAFYQGDFMEGVVIDGESLYTDWILPERARLKQLVLDAFDQLIDICIEQEDYEAGIRYAQRLLRLDEWREDAHQQLMRMYARSGQRAQALKQFEICRQVMWDEFGALPTEVTQQLYEQILAMEEGQAPQIAEPLLIEADGAPFLAPKLIPHFIGRAKELSRLREKLLQPGTNRVFALVGMAGIGKSSMAIEAAHALRDAFPDGVLWTHAATDDPKSVAERWAKGYGYDFSRIPDLEERAAVIRDLLQEKQVLIVFDDVIGSSWLRSFIPDSPWCVVLLTMRDARWAQALRAQVVEVDRLSPQDGRALLADIVTPERVTAEEETADRIVQLLDGLPLAIALAAQRLALLPRRRLSWLLERLQYGLAEHGEAVRTSFELSWEGLDANLQRIFAMLSVFGGRDFHVRAMAAVAELTQFPMHSQLDLLVTLSLLNEDEDGRFRQHNLLSLFAKEKLGDDDPPFRRMIDYFQTYAQANQENYAALEPEWENLSASIEEAYERSLWPTVVQMTETLQPAWFRRGRYFEARRAFPLAVTAAEALNDQPALARCLYHWGYICWEQNDWDVAEEKYLASLMLFKELGDFASEADTLYQLAILAKHQVDFENATHYLEACREIRESLDDQKGIAEIIFQEAQLEFSRGNYETSRPLFEHSLSIQKGLNDKMGLLRMLRVLARTLRILGSDLGLVESHLQKAFELADELEDQVERSVILLDMAGVFLRQEKYQEAKEMALKSLDMGRNLGDRRRQAMVFYVLSEISHRQQACKDALRYSEQSLALCRVLDDKPGIAFALQRLGDVWACNDQNKKAVEAWNEALEIAQQIPNKTLTIELQERLTERI